MIREAVEGHVVWFSGRDDARDRSNSEIDAEFLLATPLIYLEMCVRMMSGFQRANAPFLWKLIRLVGGEEELVSIRITGDEMRWFVVGGRMRMIKQLERDEFAIWVISKHHPGVTVLLRTHSEDGPSDGRR
jgi:hypothetical protein